jgi:HK97 family phage portal protein
MTAVVQSEGALVSAHRSSPTILSGITMHGGDTADYATLFREQPNVRLVVGFLARNIAQLGLHAFEKVTAEERRRLAPTHGLSRFIRSPNPYVTRYAFVNAMVHDLGIYDRWHALKLRNQQTGRLVAFRLPPYMVKPIGENWFYPEAWEIKGSKAKLEVAADQVVTIHGYNPTDDRIGLSPLESLRRVVAEEAAAGHWREQYWNGAARISGVIERPVEAPKWSDTARTRFRSDWQSTYAGNGAFAGATPILEEGMAWKAASFSPKDSEYLGARRLSREETAAAYFVSPLFVGILDHANFANVAEQHKHLYQDTLGPRLVDVEEEWERQIVPEFPDLDPDLTYLEFNLAEKLKGSFEEQAAAMQTATGAPWMTRNEARALRNMPPVDGGDQLVTPLNVLVGGQASPRDSAPPPALASRAAGRKSVTDLPATSQGWQAKHVEVLHVFFARQEAAVASAIVDGADLDDAWDDAGLEADLWGLAVAMTEELGPIAAERFGGTYDSSVTLAYLGESSRIAAENVNTATREALAAAIAEAEDDDDLDLADGVAAVFALAAGGRSDEIATTRTTSLANFAEHEAATQAGLVYKVWRVNSSNPRAGHPADGETVPVDETFSNGARWPGDAAAGVDQTAGCVCSLEFTTEAP